MDSSFVGEFFILTSELNKVQANLIQVASVDAQRTELAREIEALSERLQKLLATASFDQLEQLVLMVDALTVRVQAGRSIAFCMLTKQYITEGKKA